MSGLLTNWSRSTPPVIAVIDDDETERFLLSDDLRKWGYQSESFKGNYTDVKSLISEVRAKQSDFVICDNHLQQAGYARFFGAEAVVALIQSGIPSILVTQHQDSDVTRLKKWRPQLPVILDKSNIDKRNVELAFDKCSAEVKGIVAPDRRPYRVLMEVDGLYETEVIAFVDAWRPRESVSFPLNLLGSLAGSIGEGTLLLAEVNIGATNRRELFFTKFELAPEPDPDDGLS
ncbi:MAG TPA: hypothetical protein ENH04_04260 [Nitrospirae bacterium]|nr:hypothetical protein [Nitrospirota bacterium]